MISLFFPCNLFSTKLFHTIFFLPPCNVLCELPNLIIVLSLPLVWNEHCTLVVVMHCLMHITKPIVHILSQDGAREGGYIPEYSWTMEKKRSHSLTGGWITEAKKKNWFGGDWEQIGSSFFKVKNTYLNRILFFFKPEFGFP